MAKVFLSYRRADSAAVTGRIDDRLVDAFGRDNVFKDVDSIPLGMDFREYLTEAVGGCDVLLVVIGEDWLGAEDESGNRRLDDDADFVRIEVETALHRTIPVVPLLLENARMPRPDDLPSQIRELSFRNATKVRPDPDFSPDIARIIDAIKKTNAKQGPVSQRKQFAAAAQETPVISVACQCGKILRATEKFFGKRAKCPACGALVEMPSQPGVKEVARSGISPAMSRGAGSKRPIAQETEKSVSTKGTTAPMSTTIGLGDVSSVFSSVLWGVRVPLEFIGVLVGIVCACAVFLILFGGFETVFFSAFCGALAVAGIQIGCAVKASKYLGEDRVGLLLILTVLSFGFASGPLVIFGALFGRAAKKQRESTR